MMVMMKICNKVWALFFSWTALQLLWSNMDKAAISAISKIVGPQEIGKILCLVNKSSQIDGKQQKISGSVVESSSHSGWFTVLRLPVPICPRYQFPWALSVRLLFLLSSLLLLFLVLSFVFEVCVCVNFCLWRRACNLLKTYNDRHQRRRKRSRGQKKFSRMKKKHSK